MNRRLRILGALTLLVAGGARAQVPAGTFQVETLAGPPGIAPEPSALTFGTDGQLYVGFRRGGLHALDPVTRRWRKFATGLQTPMGLLAGPKGEMFVLQIAELTRLTDTDADGVADAYDTVSDAWGLSGNYHEFAEGVVRDAHGTFFVSLGLASSLAMPRPPVRGAPYFPEAQAATAHPGQVNRLQQYSPVPYRGCVVRVEGDGRISPISCGLRQPNGLVIAPDGSMFATDNQGDWVGTSPLHHVTPGAFHGHPASAHWDPTWKGGDVLQANVDDLSRRRKMPAIQFPQGDTAGSLGQPLFDTTGGNFGPYTGQMLIAEWTYPRILRAYLEKVNDVWQGAAFILLEGHGLRASNHRMAFAPDGRSLYVAQTSRIWGSVEGLQRITWTGKQLPMDILRMELTARGFDLVFTKAIDPVRARDAAAWSMTRYRYLYHAQYGSPKTDLEPVHVEVAGVSEDGRRVSLRIDPLTTDRIYELRPADVRATDGEPLCTRIAAYTVNRLRGTR
jgi:hypothetical protein